MDAIFSDWGGGHGRLALTAPTSSALKSEVYPLRADAAPDPDQVQRWRKLIVLDGVFSAPTPLDKLCCHSGSWDTLTFIKLFSLHEQETQITEKAKRTRLMDNKLREHFA